MSSKNRTIINRCNFDTRDAALRYIAQCPKENYQYEVFREESNNGSWIVEKLQKIRP